jgi:hypothetical protein
VSAAIAIEETALVVYDLESECRGLVERARPLLEAAGGAAGRDLGLMFRAAVGVDVVDDAATAVVLYCRVGFVR